MCTSLLPAETGSAPQSWWAYTYMASPDAYTGTYLQPCTASTCRVHSGGDEPFVALPLLASLHSYSLVLNLVMPFNCPFTPRHSCTFLVCPRCTEQHNGKPCPATSSAASPRQVQPGAASFCLVDFRSIKTLSGVVLPLYVEPCMAEEGACGYNPWPA